MHVPNHNQQRFTRTIKVEYAFMNKIHKKQSASKQASKYLQMSSMLFRSSFLSLFSLQYKLSIPLLGTPITGSHISNYLNQR